MTHIELRLAERNITVTHDVLLKIAKQIPTSAAIIIAHLDSVRGNSCDATESNGDLVILIVRNRQPKTIMFRRSNQPFTPDALNVDFCLSL